MARRRGGGTFQRILELVLDRRTARQTQRQVQSALNKGTDPKAARKNLTAVERGMRAVRAAALALGAVMLTAFSVRALKQFGSEVEQSRRTLIRMTGASGEALQSLQGDVRAVFAQVPESLGQVSTAVGTLNTLLGINGEMLQRTARAALDFARANEVDVASAAELVGQLVNRFNLEAAHAEGLMDRLTVAGQRTGASVTDLANNLLQAGPALSTLGFSLNEQIALVGELSRRGIDASQVTRRLSMTLSRFAQAGARDGREAWEMLIQSIQEAETELDAVGIATEAFGTRGAALAIDIRQGVLEIEGLTEALRGADGALADTEKAARTLGDELRTAGNRIRAQFMPAVEWVTRTAIPGIITAFEHGVRAIQFIADAVFLSFSRVQEGFHLVRRTMLQALGRDTSEVERSLRAVRTQIAVIEEGLFEWGVGTEKNRRETENLAGAFDEVRDAAAAASTAALQGTEEAIRREKERLTLIRQAVDLGIAESAEKVELLSRYRAITKEIEAGNVALARRVELVREQRAIEESLGLDAPTLTPPTIPDQQIAVGIGPVESMFGERARMEVDEFAWNLANTLEDPSIQRAAINAGHGISNAFRDAFSAVVQEGEGMAGMFEALFRGTGSAIAGMLAEVASSKVAENIAYAIESVATGLRLSAIGHPGASAAFAAAKEHGAAAAAWALLAGVSGGAQGAIGGGVSGGVPSGAVDPAGRQLRADRAGAEIHIHVDPIRSDSPSHQRALGKAVDQWQQRTGGSIQIHRRSS
jgi:TP901 family phage tail tape measure protein